MSGRVLAIDQGTTGTTCLVVEIGARQGARIVGRGYCELPQHFPQPGWVEHDLDEIWQTTCVAIRQALDVSKIRGADLAAIGITNQRETTGVWDVSGAPVHQAIVWQDRRTTDHCKRLTEQGHTNLIRKRTGLVLDPYFAGTKVAWLLDQVPSLRARAGAGELRFGTIDTWLIWKLSSGSAHVTDATNASRTMLFDIYRNTWDDELCALLGDVPRKMLPEVRPSSGTCASTRGAGVLPDGIPIAGIAGDQHAALFGQACFSPGMAKCTYGTGAFALVNIGARPVVSNHGLLTTVAWRLGNTSTYAIEGSTFVAGAVVQWLRDGLKIITSSSEVEALAAEVPDSGGVTFVPALTGLGAPHWRPEARGLVSGITRGTTRAHLARAALEGIALQVNDLLDAMRQDSGSPISLLRVDGGAAANNLLMQFQSDLLGIEIHRPNMLETTALGAAYLAALGIGLFSDLGEIASSWQLERIYAPSTDRQAIDARVRDWRSAVGKA
jgi:glycerol kinase